VLLYFQVTVVYMRRPQIQAVCAGMPLKCYNSYITTTTVYWPTCLDMTTVVVWHLTTTIFYIWHFQVC